MIGQRRGSVVLAGCLVACLSACAAFGRAGGSGPTIEALRPDSVFVAPGTVVEVVVRGRGFVPGSPGRNTVRFGTVVLTNVPASDDGREIRVVVPDRVPSGGDAAPLPIETGRYDIRVENAAGISNTVVVRVFR